MRLAQIVTISALIWGFLVLFNTAKAQVLIAPHSVFVNLGAGFQGSRFYTSNWRPSYHAHVEYAVFKNTTVGVEGAYYGEKIAKESRFSSYSVGLRSSYYFNSLLKRANKKVNYYAGLSVLYYNYKYTDFSATKGTVYLPIHLGLKRRFSKNLAAYTELGFNDMGFLKIGLAANL